jgi:simple sugar transport system permease protein
VTRVRKDFKTILRDNAVTILFVVMCILCICFSGQPLSYVMFELFGRLSRNAFIVLALMACASVVITKKKD